MASLPSMATMTTEPSTASSPTPRRPGRRRRRAGVLGAAGVVLVLCTAVLAACSSGDDNKVVVYSGRSTDLIKPVLDRFAAETGISVDFKQGDSADLALTIEQEGERSPADVFISQSPGATAYLDDKGLLRPLPQSTLDRVAAEDRAGDGNWVGLSGRVRVLVYNTDLVSPDDLPATVEELTGAAYQGKVGMAPTNGSFQDFVSAMRISEGDDATTAWLEGMAANDVKTYANNNAVVDAVIRGEVPMGLANHYYLLRALEDDPDAPAANHVFADDVGSVEIVSTASVLAGAQHTPQAERLVDFLLSDETQRYFADETFEYPVVAGVPPAATVPELAAEQVLRVDFDELGSEFASTVTMIRDAGLTR